MNNFYNDEFETKKSTEHSDRFANPERHNELPQESFVSKAEDTTLNSEKTEETTS